MNIQQFQYILALADTRHFETAANKCFISQSTLSTMISRFEKEIGVLLFDRKKKPVMVTKEGELLIEQIRVILHEINQLSETVKEIKGEIKGTIRIGCIPTVAPFLLPLFLQEFSKKYPNLFIEIKEKNTEEILHRIQSRDLDIGILSSPVLTSGLLEIPLYQEAFVLYDSSKHNDRFISPAKINTENFWLLEEGHCMRNQVIEICTKGKNKINPSLNINFKAGSINSLLRFTQANKGKTLLPFLSILDFNKKELKNISFFKSPVPSREIGLVYHRHFAKKKILHLFRNEILSKVGALKLVPKFPTGQINVSLNP